MIKKKYSIIKAGEYLPPDKVIAYNFMVEKSSWEKELYTSSNPNPVGGEVNEGVSLVEPIHATSVKDLLSRYSKAHADAFYDEGLDIVKTDKGFDDSNVDYSKVNLPKFRKRGYSKFDALDDAKKSMDELNRLRSNVAQPSAVPEQGSPDKVPEQGSPDKVPEKGSPDKVDVNQILPL